MNVNELKNIIRKEVREAVRAEIKDVIIEAVKIASTPVVEQNVHSYKPVKEKDISRTWSTGEMNPGTMPLEEMLNQTKREMTPQEYNNIISANSTMVEKPNFQPTNAATTAASQMNLSAGNLPGIDLSQLGFVQKAKAILDKSIEKDKQRGVN